MAACRAWRSRSIVQASAITARTSRASVRSSFVTGATFSVRKTRFARRSSGSFVCAAERGEYRGAVAGFDIVALVASAGGLKALTEVLHALPAGFPARKLYLANAPDPDALQSEPPTSPQPSLAVPSASHGAAPAREAKGQGRVSGY